MAQNHKKVGDHMTAIVPSGGCLSGQAYLFGVKLGVALHSKPAGVSAEFAMTQVYDLPKANPLVINQGDALYWDNTARVLNKTASGNTLVGYAFEPAESTAETVAIKLNG